MFQKLICQLRITMTDHPELSGICSGLAYLKVMGSMFNGKCMMLHIGRKYDTNGSDSTFYTSSRTHAYLCFVFQNRFFMYDLAGDSLRMLKANRGLYEELTKSALELSNKNTSLDRAEECHKVAARLARRVRHHKMENVTAYLRLVKENPTERQEFIIENLKIRQGKDSFSVSYDATAKDKTQGLRYSARIDASADGTVMFQATGTPLTDFLTNRTGFVVLHPLVGVVGEPVEITHTDGKVRKSRFPKFISPGQPVSPRTWNQVL